VRAVLPFISTRLAEIGFRKPMVYHAGMAKIEIPNFPGGKRIAVTLSFDDGVESDIRAIEFFNRVGLKGTFNVNSSLLGGFHDWGGVPYLKREQVAAAYRGHEVAIHTRTHPWLTRLDSGQIALEVLDDKRALEELVGYPVRGMAYPYGDYDERVIEVLRGLGEQTVAYARTTVKADKCFPPDERLAWHATAHIFEEGLVEKWEQWYAGEWFRGVFFVWGHTYEFEMKKDWGAMERIFSPFAGKNDVWYCTNLELFDYEAARRRLVVAANGGSVFNPSGIQMTVLVEGKQMEVRGGETLRV
jgi:hypothetical protein